MEPVAKQTQMLGKKISFSQIYLILKYFIFIQTKPYLVINKKHLYNAGDIQLAGGRGGIISHTLTVLVIPVCNTV